MTIWKYLDIPTSFQDTFGPEDALSKLNPTTLPGVHYLCGACETSTIPDPEDGRLKKKGSSATDEVQLPQSQSQQSVAHDASMLNEETQADKHDDEEQQQQTQLQPQQQQTAQVPQQQTAQVQQQQTAQVQQQQTAQVQQQQQLQPRQMLVQLPTASPAHSQESSQPQSRQAQHQQQTHRNICRFYRQGTCKHGLTGRNCPQEHPPPCRRLMKHGNRSPQGCTSGRACEYFHPKMCPTSLSKRECFKADCKLKHIMGMKRKQPVVSQEANRTSPDEASTPDRNYFLEAMQAMRMEIMSALDQRLAALQSIHPMAMGEVQGSPQPMVPTQIMRTPQQVVTAWPGYSVSGQGYLWPPGQAVDIRHLTQGAAASTSQPQGLVPTPTSYWLPSPSSTSRDWSLGQSLPKSRSSRTSFSTVTSSLLLWQKPGCRSTWMRNSMATLYSGKIDTDQRGADVAKIAVV